MIYRSELRWLLRLAIARIEEQTGRMWEGDRQALDLDYEVRLSTDKGLHDLVGPARNMLQALKEPRRVRFEVLDTPETESAQLRLKYE